MYTQNQEYIVEQTGAETLEQVLAEYNGLTLEQITDALNALFPFDDNTELATAIVAEL